MSMKKPIIIAVALVAIAVVIYQFMGSEDLTLPSLEAKPVSKLNKLPDFSNFADVKEKKKTFFDTLYPIIEEENKHIVKVRGALIALEATPFDTLQPKQITWLSKVAKYYRVDDDPVNDTTISTLLDRVDVIPPSLALTQAAIESGWGSSRFSRTGNNLFGQWCFTKGCGMVPSARDSDKGHEVSKFSTVNAAVRAYMKNLNSHPAYQKLRDVRAQIRKDNGKVTGVALAQTLIEYSEEREKYVTKVSKFIKQNKLQLYTQRFEELLVTEAAM